MVIWVIPSLIVALGVGVWLHIYFHYGQEPTPKVAPGVVSEPPSDWTPAQVSLLWGYGRLRPRDMVASFLDLVRRGVLRLHATPVDILLAGGLAGTDQEYDFVVARVRSTAQRVTPAERYLIDEVLFHYAPGREQASLRHLMLEGARDHLKACGRADRWLEIAEKEQTPFAFEDAQSKRMSRVALAVGFAMLGLAYPLAGMFESPVAVLAIAVGGAMVAGSKAVRRRTQEAAEALASWQAYRDYLAEQSTLSDSPAHSVAVWEKHLVYAVTLGTAQRVINRFQMLYPTMQNIDCSLYPSVFSLGVDAFDRALASLISRAPVPSESNERRLQAPLSPLEEEH